MAFLEESDEDQVEPFAAARCLENMSHYLLQLEGVDRQEFIELLEEMASEEESESQAKRLRELPFVIGMIEKR
ncbi:hypothetical protein [Actinomadura kijaniata]|uniref:hypothetical protein n=1 Tax=Actinomadura kijaniata TaxID=46161 RepID=UPI0012FA5C65|nr:hypothetical protein [Actinomadura kijaniata]